jgi:hypothetical protein
MVSTFYARVNRTLLGAKRVPALLFPDDCLNHIAILADAKGKDREPPKRLRCPIRLFYDWHRILIRFHLFSVVTVQTCVNSAPGRKLIDE